ncbi:MAG: DNA polymerase III subunit delta, partial [Candidatus Desulfacyla sp.]
MAVYTADQQDKILDSIRQNKVAQVYLLFGERFLCRQAAEKVCQALLTQGGTLHPVDGDREKFTTTLQKLSSFSLFPGRQVYRVSDTRLFHSIQVAESLWKKTVKAWADNEPARAVRHLRSMLETAGLNPDDAENDPSSLSPARWKKLFGFARPQSDLAWIGPLLAENAGREQFQHARADDDPAALLEKHLDSGLPGRNVLVLTTEDVDKRKRLYKLLAEKYVVLDLGVEAGSGSRAQAAQKKVLLDLLHGTLKEFDKTISREAADLLCERVGFHPVAVVRESEKLALYTGSRTRIDTSDLDAIVGRTRQEALFELTDALGKRELERALLVAARLEEHGIHPLAVIATLKNYTRNL